jgi:hypothetical protein
MTDLDTELLRRALRASPEPEPPFDPAAIITRGRRLRWRRRAAAAVGGVCLAAAVFGAVAGVGRLTAPSSVPIRHTITPVGPVGSPGPRPRLVPSPRRDEAAPTASASPAATATTAPATTASPTSPAWGLAPTPSPSGGSGTSAAPGSSLTSTPTEQSRETPIPTPTAAR